MAEHINIATVDNSSEQPTVASTIAESTKSSTQTAAAGTSSIKTTFSSMEAFRRKEPKLYEAFMKGVAQIIMSDMKRHADELKRMLREQRRT